MSLTSVLFCLIGIAPTAKDAQDVTFRQRVLAKFDTDEDGRLNASERQALRKAGSPFARKRPGFRRPRFNPATVKKYDKDGNGELDGRKPVRHKTACVPSGANWLVSTRHSRKTSLLSQISRRWRATQNREKSRISLPTFTAGSVAASTGPAATRMATGIDDHAVTSWNNSTPTGTDVLIRRNSGKPEPPSPKRSQPSRRRNRPASDRQLSLASTGMAARIVTSRSKS